MVELFESTFSNIYTSTDGYKAIEININIPEPISLICQENHLQQALINVLHHTEKIIHQ